MENDQAIGVGLIGCGTVGAGVVRLLTEKKDLYAARLGRQIALRRILVRDPARTERGVQIDRSFFTGDAETFLADEGMSIVVELAGGLDPIGEYVRRALAAGKHVVTANKSLLAARGPDLFATARANGACIAFEASCGGGIPIITALQFGLTANRIRALYGILNGTCNYILTEMSQRAKPYAQALREAQQAGFAEADPALDVSGRDAAEKLAILASLAFSVRIEPDMVACDGIETLDLADIRFGAELGYQIKLLAIARSVAGPDDANCGPLSLRVGPCFTQADQPLAKVDGSFNALAVDGDAVGHTMYVGRGAGQMPTASAVVADLLNVASGWYATAFGKLNLWLDQQEQPNLQPWQDHVGRFYIRISARDEPGVIAKVSTILGDAGISCGAVLQHEVSAGKFVPLVIVTHEAAYGALSGALDQIEQLDVIEGKPVCIPIVDMRET